MGLMVWSNNAMTTRYQHLTPGLRRDIARQVDELLWTNSRTDETTNHR
jgi:integrase